MARYCDCMRSAVPTRRLIIRRGERPSAAQEIAVFDAEYDTPTLAPVVVIIAAYNEAKGIGAVLDGMPVKTTDDEPLDIATVVVVDGGSDNTAAAGSADDERRAFELGAIALLHGGVERIHVDVQYRAGIRAPHRLIPR